MLCLHINISNIFRGKNSIFQNQKNQVKMTLFYIFLSLWFNKVSWNLISVPEFNLLQNTVLLLYLKKIQPGTDMQLEQGNVFQQSFQIIVTIFYYIKIQQIEISQLQYGVKHINDFFYCYIKFIGLCSTFSDFFITHYSASACSGDLKNMCSLNHADLQMLTHFIT